MLLETYLKGYDIEPTEILDEIRYTESQLTNLPVIQYPEELVQKLSHKLHKDKSVIWIELLELEDHQSVTRINRAEELIDAVESQQAYIFIPEAIRQEQRRLINSVLTEKDRLGFELGSKGAGNILAEIIYQIGRFFDQESKEFKRIKSKLRHYYIKVHDDSGSLLYGKEQTY